ncbi:MAG: phenylalanine--tRNA ligase subunit beta [Proteobacteria bacterium]|nr:phenylalanine--tRNA ligase subunit beta [Desulfobulbaceae bacterium]MBU4152233.1 phenylalanine--tRNA ligase subunit beta [Pseudomonadota bacterium]
MKFTVNWLKQYVDFSFTPTELAHRLTMLGLEVDAVEALYQNIDQIKVARVLSVAKHPNADKLTLCEVIVGDDRKKIVCGAPNVKAGMLVPVALPGCTMPAGFVIKTSKLRGEVSEGMLCSGTELGIAIDSAGLMELSEECRCGDRLVDALGLLDTMIEVDITPNRADCTSLIGIAREVAGVTGAQLKMPVSSAFPLATNHEAFAVEVSAPEACPRYAARLLKNVTVGPSPWWLKRLLMAVGLRPINNVVDITNFVMLEYGQPLHAFDFSLVHGQKIIVRNAVEGERMTTLDGVDRSLDADMLLICDGQRPVAIAGVMGGQNSEVSAQTTEILLESACFDAVGIRRTSRALALSTDASYRFERGVDPRGTINALERAAQLIVELCEAELVPGGIDCAANSFVPKQIILRTSRTCAQLGISVDQSEISSLLARIGIESTVAGPDTLQVIAPSFRVDIEREIDLIEEIARLKGYNEIPSTMPVVPMSMSVQDPARSIRQRLATVMVALGAYEAVNYSFTSERYGDLLGLRADDPLRNQVKLINPLADDQGVMRTMLLPGLMENLKHNLNRQNSDIGLFEIGKVFWPVSGQEQPHEGLRLTAVFSGRPGVDSPVLHYGSRLFDVYDLKGIVEIIMNQLGLSKVQCVAFNTPPIYVDQAVSLAIVVGDLQVGILGQLKRSTLKSFGIKQDVFFFDIDLDLIFDLEPARPLFKPLSKFPSVSWDLACVVREDVGAGKIAASIMDNNFPLVRRVEIFDVYRGKPIAEGMKSVALSITYHSEEQTLDDGAVGKVHNAIMEFIRTRFDGQLREL